MTDCGSHVQCVLNRSDCKVEKDTVTLAEEKGDITYVDQGHDVEPKKSPRHVASGDHHAERRCQRRDVGNGKAHGVRLMCRRLMSSGMAWFPSP